MSDVAGSVSFGRPTWDDVELTTPLFAKSDVDTYFKVRKNHVWFDRIPAVLQDQLRTVIKHDKDITVYAEDDLNGDIRRITA